MPLEAGSQNALEQLARLIQQAYRAIRQGRVRGAPLIGEEHQPADFPERGESSRHQAAVKQPPEAVPEDTKGHSSDPTVDAIRPQSNLFGPEPSDSPAKPPTPPTRPPPGPRSPLEAPNPSPEGGGSASPQELVPGPGLGPHSADLALKSPATTTLPGRAAATIDPIRVSVSPKPTRSSLGGMQTLTTTVPPYRAARYPLPLSTNKRGRGNAPVRLQTIAAEPATSSSQSGLAEGTR
ncbi:nascent polypeptide-associated complex subunit alpha, muscle-specific form-like [Monomorium pharaonis]|uniref:nascent polypeptide-associated complex subunit alpha, muscle-specific form-like n=1 Tax=Monomorium pharaonis TaxID=307658 RepID=UPI001746D7E6|nr:nascent polypeptide-associated complex subunit alpha, muscle-specific form-like [Monomorium pharaonis]